MNESIREAAVTKELVGWKEIAARLGVTVRAAQRYAAMERDPLPCYRRLRSVRLDPAQLEAWIDRHREPVGDAPPTSVVLVPSDPRLAPLVRLFHRAALRVLERAAGGGGATDARQVTVDDYLREARRVPRRARRRGSAGARGMMGGGAMTTPALGLAARRYAVDLGWAVLPIHSIRGDACSCERADCGSAGKHPRTKRGLKDATRDVEQIARWWSTGPTRTSASSPVA